MWKLPNGKVTRVPKGIQVGDVKYPASIFRRWSKEELATLGIKPYREVRYDQRWYKSVGSTEEEIDGMIVKTHTTVEKYTPEEATESQTLQIRDQYVAEMTRAVSLADFYDAVGDSDGKKLWTDYVDALKTDAKSLKDAVNNAGTYDAIINLQFQWTEAPDGSIQSA
jgi:hypothetical protein